jgi:transcriptional regulator with XRE-family HTH domain
MEGEGTPVSAMIAERLTRLIDTVHPPGRRYSVREIAEKINTKAGRQVISHTYVNDLQRGNGIDPTIGRLKALAEFFGVSLLYFFDDDVARRTDQQLDGLAALRDQGVVSLALRSNGLSEKSLAAISSMIDGARVLEGLPEVADDAGA